jgi:O-antigen/teichoic acid export membrane protein
VVNHIKNILDSAFNHQGFLRYFTNTSWMLAEQAFRMLTGLVVGIWVARYLGPQEFGMFSYALAFVAIFSTIAKLGLDSILVRDMINAPNKTSVYLGTAFWLKVIGAFATLTFIALATYYAKNNPTINLYIFIIGSGILLQSFEVVEFYFQSKVLSKFVSICKMGQLGLSSLLKIYLILSGADLFWFVVVSLLDQVILAITLFIAYRYQKVESFYRHFDLSLAKELLRNSWPLIFSSLVVMIYMRIDQIMIKAILGEREVGIYSAAVRLTEVWYFLPVIITNSLFPAIVSAKKISADLYRIRLQRLFTFLVWASISIALPITFLSDWVVTLLYGQDYLQAGNVLMIQIWAGIFVCLGVASSSWLTSENLQLISFYRTLGGAIVNVVLNLWLIPIYGMAGAAFATLISYMFAALLFDILNHQTKQLFLMKLYAFGFKRN